MKRRMTSSFLAFFGHINIDVSIRVPVIPRVGSVNATSVSENFGGTAGNFAMVSRKLGLDFDLYSAVSLRTHSEYLDYLSSIGIDLQHVDRLEESYGPVCYISSDGNDQVAYVYQGPMDHWSPATSFPSRSEYDWVHFSTGPPEEYSKLFELIEKSKVAFDPGQEIHYRYVRETALRFIERANMFVGNEAEYDKLKTLSGKTDDEIHSLIDTIIITKGQKGVTAYDGGETYNFSVLPAERVYDTIGAGDSFRSGLYLGLSNRYSLCDSIVMGIIVSSKAIESPITDFNLNHSEVERLFRENRDRIVLE